MQIDVETLFKLKVQLSRIKIYKYFSLELFAEKLSSLTSWLYLGTFQLFFLRSMESLIMTLTEINIITNRNIINGDLEYW